MVQSISPPLLHFILVLKRFERGRRYGEVKGREKEKGREEDGRG